MIKLVILTSMWCNGITFLAEPGEPLDFIWYFLKRMPKIIAKPLLHCISCMASVHTAIVLVLYGWIFDCLSWSFMKQYFLIAPCCIFLNAVMFLVRAILEKIFFFIKEIQ